MRLYIRAETYRLQYLVRPGYRYCEDTAQADKARLIYADSPPYLLVHLYVTLSVKLEVFSASMRIYRRICAKTLASWPLRRSQCSRTRYTLRLVRHVSLASELDEVRREMNVVFQHASYSGTIRGHAIWQQLNDCAAWAAYCCEEGRAWA